MKADRFASLAIFVTLFCSYAYFFGGSGWNQNATFALTRALVEQQRLDITSFEANTGDVSFHEGRVYSNKAPGLGFLAALPYALVYAMQGAPQNSLQLNAALYVATVLSCGICGALIGVVLYRAARRRGLSPRVGYAIAMVTGLGTPLFAYSTMLFAHVPSALCVLIAWLLLDGTFERKPLLAGLAMGAATFINYLNAPLALLMVLFLRNRREVARYIAGGVPFAIALGAYQLAAFGSPFRTSIALMNPMFVQPDAMLGVFHLPRPDALWGITFSPFRGLFYLAPILIMGLAGIVMSRQWKIVGALILLLLLNASFNGWHGGYTIGPRYLLAAVPLLALGLFHIAPRLRALTIVAAAISLLLNFVVVAVDPQPPKEIDDPIRRYEVPALLHGRAADDVTPVAPWITRYYTGHTSTNRAAPDEMLIFKNHPPGSPETEWASFNLGEVWFGEGALASLLPWLLIVALATFATDLQTAQGRRFRRLTRRSDDPRLPAHRFRVDSPRGTPLAIRQRRDLARFDLAATAPEDVRVGDRDCRCSPGARRWRACGRARDPSPCRAPPP